MTKEPTGRRPSQEEFLQTVETEFAFLTQEEGYAREITGDYSVDFTKGASRLNVSGINYGMAATMEFKLDGEYCPLGGFFSSMEKPPAFQSTGAPQLDAIREYAWRLRHGLRGLLQGRPEFIVKARAAVQEWRRVEESLRKNSLDNKKADFFTRAEELFKAGDYASCARHLESSGFPLMDSWKAKLDYARKHS